MDNECRRKAFEIASALRKSGVIAEIEKDTAEGYFGTMKVLCKTAFAGKFRFESDHGETVTLDLDAGENEFTVSVDGFTVTNKLVPTDIPEEDPPTTDIPEEDPPKSDIPDTRDHTAYSAALAALAAGLTGTIFFGRKRREEN